METDVGHLHLSFSTLTFPLVENEDEGWKPLASSPTSFHCYLRTHRLNNDKTVKANSFPVIVTGGEEKITITRSQVPDAGPTKAGSFWVRG